MKKSFVAVWDPGPAEITMYKVEPTMEWLQEKVQGHFQHIRPQPGVDVYCDEDGEMKRVPVSCIIRWAPPSTGMKVADVPLRGPVVMVFRTAKKQAEALAKLAIVLKGVLVGNEEGGFDLKYDGEGVNLPTVH